MKRPAHPAHRRAAFTLVEVLVALGITSLTVAMLLPFFIFNVRSIFHGEQKLLINQDIRDVTNQMVAEARESSYFALYESFHDRNSASGESVSRDANSDGVINELDRRLAGDTGDFLVLVFTANNAIYDSRFYDDVAGNEPAYNTQVTRIVGYWVARNRVQPSNPDGSARNALYTFDSDDFRPASGGTWNAAWGATFPATLSPTAPLESLLPPATATAASNSAYARIVVQDLAGRTSDGRNFINFANKTVVVQTRVLHGNRAKRVTNTYNLAITPRG